MATIKDIKINNYCDDLNNDLTAMKVRIDALRDEVKTVYGPESEVFRTHDRHLLELSDIIEWKLQNLMKVCPFEWKGMDKDVERIVSVREPERAMEADISGGYLGG
jgi:hypothetical protein